MSNATTTQQHLLSILLLTILSFTTTAQITYTANDLVPPYNDQFRPGVNLGVFPPWTDEQLGDLSAGNPETGLKGIGAKSVRPALYEDFLEQYGYDYRIGTFQHYDNLKLKDNTVIVGFPSEAHRDQNHYCPSAQSELFANMYEPIWDNGENGTPINDENYYALYLYKVVTRYKAYTKFWEIWNEPGFDYTGALGWFPPGAEGNWWDNNPDPCDYKLRAPIFHYVRLLRISYEVIKFLDPEAYVVLSGTGFPSFLDAIMRNTDNPLDGSPTAEFPEGGGAYFDVMGFHSYPHFDGSIRVWSDEINGFEYSRHSDAAARGIFKSKQLFQDVLADYGYDGETYPEKLWIITECNIPRKQFSDFIGSEMAQRNFIMKAYWECVVNDILQLHVYSLGEDEKIEDAISEFETMGMYQKLTIERPNFVKVNEEGMAYKTTSDLLFNKSYDVAKTIALNLPDEVAGGAFNDENGNYTYMLWAKTDTDRSEDNTTTYSFPTDWHFNQVEKYEWNYSETLERAMVSSQDIELTSTPIFLIKKQFILSENTGCIPFEIDLSIEDENSELSYHWTFEGGEPATSTATHPSVIFNQTGTFNITLNIQDATGNTVSTQTDHIIVEQLPEPNFEAYVAGPIANLSNQSSVNSQSYLWDFGDGNHSTAPNPEHVFFENGNRSIELTATNACGSVTTSQDFEIEIPTTSQVDYTANDVVPSYNGHFRPGVNFGVFLGWPDENLADISAGNLQKGIAGTGAKSVRPAFYDENLEVWGYDVLTRAYDHYENLNLKDNTVIVGFPADERQDPNYYCLTKQSEHFDRMYLDIWDNGENGTPINDENYYAVYLYETVSRLKGHVKFWEIWNEPSFDHSSFKGWLPRGQRGNWWDNNPEACDYKLRAPIFHFVRLLRVSYEIIKYLDPDALVTLSGVSYPSFLDAILRNTDNPKDGAVTATYPLGGGAYFDVMGFHSYPHFDGSTSYFDTTIVDWVYHRHSDAAAEGVPRVKNILGEVLEDYGYNDSTFPAKHWVITEINIPRKQIAQSIGSEEAQRNFIIKAYVQALKAEMLQFHIYAISELGEYDNAFSEFDVMGLYEKLDEVPLGQEVLNDEGIAYKTISDLLYGTTYDVAQTAALNLADHIDGGAFRDSEDNFIYVLWAKTQQDQSEVAEAVYSFPANLDIPFVYKKDWDFSRTLQNQFSEASNIALTGAPVFLSPTLEVMNAPTAAFYAPTPVACTPLTVNFQDLSAEATAWEWTFEGGEPITSTEQHPTVLYQTPGFYSVQLTAKNAAGEHTFTATNYVHAQTEPEIDFTFTTDGAWGHFELDTPFDGVTTFHWDFDDGFDFPAYNPSHYFFFNGDYNVQLISTNDCGADTTIHIVSIGAAPTAEFTQLIETDCDGPATVEFKDLSPSSPTTWNWTFPEGSPITATTIKDPIVVYEQPGTYEATLIVNNTFGSDTITQEVFINGNITTELAPTLCTGESLIVNGVVYDETQPSGVEIFAGITSIDCDSIVTVDIAFAETPISHLEETLCSEDFRIVNGTIYNIDLPTGTEILVYASQLGCDSIVQIDLDFYESSPATVLQESLCVGDFMVVNGTVYDEDNPSGTEVFVDATANSCDSTVQIDLSFFEPPMLVAADISGDDGTASGSIALMVEQGLSPYVFAWSNGGTGAAIEDLEAGIYEVTVTDGNGCGFVETFEVDMVVGIDGIAPADVGVRLFPNPVGESGLVFGELRGVVDFPVGIRVFDALGRVVLERVVLEERFSLVLGDVGVYFLEVGFGDGGKRYFKVLKTSGF